MRGELSVSEQLYGALLYLYPKNFRAAYGHPLSALCHHWRVLGAAWYCDDGPETGAVDSSDLRPYIRKGERQIKRHHSCF